MPDTLIITIPNAASIFLAARYPGIPVLHVDDGVCGVRKSRNTDPETGSTCGGIVIIDLMIQLVVSCRIAGEDDVVAIRVLYPAAIGNSGQIAVSSGDQYGEVSLIGIRNLRVINGDRPIETERRHQVYSSCSALGAVRGAGSGYSDGLRCGDGNRRCIQPGGSDAAHAGRCDGPVDRSSTDCSCAELLGLSLIQRDGAGKQNHVCAFRSQGVEGSRRSLIVIFGGNPISRANRAGDANFIRLTIPLTTGVETRPDDYIVEIDRPKRVGDGLG